MSKAQEAFTKSFPEDKRDGNKYGEYEKPKEI